VCIGRGPGREGELGGGEGGGDTGSAGGGGGQVADFTWYLIGEWESFT